MFWIVFLGVLISLYIVGMLIAFGLLIVNYEESDEDTHNKVMIVIFGTLLSWITIGIYLHEKL